MTLSDRGYTVGCIRPMGVELDPAKAMLDVIHPSSPTDIVNATKYGLRMGESSVPCTVECLKIVARASNTTIVFVFPAES